MRGVKLLAVHTAAHASHAAAGRGDHNALTRARAACARCITRSACPQARCAAAERAKATWSEVTAHAYQVSCALGRRTRRSQSCPARAAPRMPALAPCARATPMSSLQPEHQSSRSVPPAPPATPARPARLLRAAAARQVLRGVSAQPLSAAVQHAEQEALGRRRHAERFRLENLTGLWRKDWSASDSMVRAQAAARSRGRCARVWTQRVASALARPELASLTRRRSKRRWRRWSCRGSCARRYAWFQSCRRAKGSAAPRAVTLMWSAPARFQPARSRRPRAPQIRHDEAEFATCLRAGIINVAETYSLKGTRPRGLATSDAPSDGSAARDTASAHAHRALTAVAPPSRRAAARGRSAS